MRSLNAQAELGDLAPELRSVIEDCLRCWVESEVLDDPESDTPVYLVEVGDTMDRLVAISGLLAALDDPDDVPPFEWVTDWHCAFEAVLVLSDSGSGFSLIVPKVAGILPSLLDACTRLATNAA